MLYNEIFFYACVFFYFVATAFFIAYLFKREAALFGYSKQWFSVGFVAGVFFFFIRYRELGFLPLVTLFEITFFYAWLSSGVYILFVKETMGRLVPGLVIFIFDGIFLIDLFLDKTLHLLNPLLNSFWLGIHVPAVIVSYSAFGLSFAISVYYLIAQKKGKPVRQLDSLNRGLILTGVVLLGVGIVTGAIWAHSAWGRYWNWDPKETWALITFLIYGFCAVARPVFKFSPGWLAVLSIAGFLAMLFTFFGVSLLLASHHAYTPQ